MQRTTQIRQRAVLRFSFSFHIMPHTFPLYSQNLNVSRIHICTYALANVLFPFPFLIKWTTMFFILRVSYVLRSIISNQERTRAKIDRKTRGQISLELAITLQTHFTHVWYTSTVRRIIRRSGSIFYVFRKKLGKWIAHKDSS